MLNLTDVLNELIDPKFGLIVNLNEQALCHHKEI